MIRPSRFDDAGENRPDGFEVAGPPLLGKRHPASADVSETATRSSLMCRLRQVFRDFLEYQRAKAKSGHTIDEFFRLYRLFLTGSGGGSCLRLVFSADRETELGPNWATLDLSQIAYEESAKRRAVSIDLEEEYFDAVLLTGLEHVSRPEPLIAEVRRVLKRSGQIWVQVPLCTPFHVARKGAHREYWRLTPDGLRMLFEAFDEVFCSVYNPGGSELRVVSFFYGIKPPIEEAPIENDDLLVESKDNPNDEGAARSFTDTPTRWQKLPIYQAE